MSGAELIAGRATPAGTARLAARHSGAEFHRAAWGGLGLASIGLGTYLGDPTDALDARYAAAVRRYLSLGGNLIDTAINYRFQRSERAIGIALRAAIDQGEVSRDEVVICTKGGFVPFDGRMPADPIAWMRTTFVEAGVAELHDVVDGHCLRPAYLRHQIEHSRRNLGVACIDLYYLHNPETQRAGVGEAEFLDRLREAFAALEAAEAAGHIAAYGVATWDGLRAEPAEPSYLSVDALVQTARGVAGDRHHFRAVQLPVNLQMLEALGRRNQPGPDGPTSLLNAAIEFDLSVIASAPLLQARLLNRLPGHLRARFAGCDTDAQRAIQFARSTPGLAAALVGMSRPEHVDENLKLRDLPPMSLDEYHALFRS